ncbi:MULTISPECIES: hotdog domain-containing protein [unclassified Streptomyces]|uniref:acyl-CoA thioesterase n=1 Tax=unclassified Streptomyces TaxID=2593676 RepID=UPI0033DE8E31
MNAPWKTEFELREEYVDCLGHVTAAAHLTLFELAYGHWFAELMAEPAPPFALVRLELDYRRELLLTDGPVTASVAPVRLTRSTVTVREELRSAPYGVHTGATAILVRWDRERRRSMPFPPSERAGIEAQLAR